MLFYGFIGCEAFANITEGEIVTEYLNFNDIGKALLVLFKACTNIVELIGTLPVSIFILIF